MKTPQLKPQRHGFTLIEMVGVLAVIAILAALLVPKIFAAINESRVSTAATAINTAKTAAIGYFGKYGQWAGIDGASLQQGQAAAWHDVLLKSGYLDKPFGCRVGTSASVQLRSPESATTDPTVSNSAYNLDGDVNTKNDASAGLYVVEVKIQGVDAEDAKAIKLRFDSAATEVTVGEGETAVGGNYTDGRVKYDAANKVLLAYIAHK